MNNIVPRLLAPVGKMALSNDDEYSIIQVINTIQAIGEIAAEKRLQKVTYNTIINIREIGISAINQNLEWSTQMAIAAIEEIGKISVEKRFKILAKEGGWWEVSNLEMIGKKAIEHRLENAAQLVAASLFMVGDIAAKNKLKSTLSKSIETLETIAECAGREKLCEVIESISTSLRLIIGGPIEPDELSNAMNALEKANAYLEEFSCAQKSKNIRQ